MLHLGDLQHASKTRLGLATEDSSGLGMHGAHKNLRFVLRTSRRPVARVSDTELKRSAGNESSPFRGNTSLLKENGP